jgi:drug/metabolite transporter (DMT)-like permease
VTKAKSSLYGRLCPLSACPSNEAISNITLVKAIKYIGPTLTSIFGALEPLTAVVIGCLIFNESFTPASAIGMALIITAVTVVVVHEKKKESES